MFTHEIIRYDEKLPIKLMLQKIGRVEMHWHESMELLMVLTGKMRVEVENRKIELLPEDLILINHHQMHATTGEDCVLVALQMRSSLFEGFVGKNTVFRLCSAGAVQSDRFDRVRRIFAHLVLDGLEYEKQQDSTVSHLIVQARLYELMAELYSSFRDTRSETPIHSSEALKRLENITTYLSEHYREPITLKEVAQNQYLTVPYLSSFFEKNMGMTFTAFLTELRLRSAYVDLMQTGRLIDEIAAQNGFPNTRSFVAAFRKKYGMLPSKFRATVNEPSAPLRLGMQGNSAASYLKIEKNDYLAVLKKYADIRPTAAAVSDAERRVSETVDASVSGVPLRHTWRTFTSVGRAKELLLEPVRACLSDLQKELHFSYIKFHGILDDAMMVYREDRHGNPVHNFVYVDSVFDYLLGLGLKPLVQLSFMPSALAKTPDHALFASPVVISEPKDDGRWCDLIRDFTNHLIARYGRAEVRTWFFTFWNEPYGATPFHLSSDAVKRLYALTYRTVKECDPAIPFGSPSFIAALTEEEERDFLSFCRDAGCPPDLHLIHAYQVAPSGSSQEMQALDSHSTLSEDPDEFKKQITRARELLGEFSDKKIYLTEWNFSPSHRDWLNDTCFRSCFLTRNLLENYDDLESFGIWTATDFIEELTPGHALFHGGMGLYTRNGIPKPARVVLGMLTHLRDRCIWKSEGCFVTADDRGYTAVFYHYQHFSSLWAKGILLDNSPVSRYDFFTDHGKLQTELSFRHLRDGVYTVTEYILNRSVGSAYDAWQKMGGLEPETAEEITYLKDSARPGLRRTKTTVTGESLHYEAVLEPLEVRVVTFDRDESL